MPVRKGNYEVTAVEMVEMSVECPLCCFQTRFILFHLSCNAFIGRFLILMVLDISAMHDELTALNGYYFFIPLRGKMVTHGERKYDTCLNANLNGKQMLNNKRKTPRPIIS